MAIELHLVHRITRYEVTNTGVGLTADAAIADFRRQFAEIYLRENDSSSYGQEMLRLMETIAEDLISSGGYAGDADGNYVYHLETVTIP